MRYLLVLGAIVITSGIAHAQETNPWADMEEEAPEPPRPKNMQETPTPKKTTTPTASATARRKLPPGTNKIWVISLRGGDTVRGRIESQTSTSIILRLATGKARSIPRSKILSIEPLFRKKQPKKLASRTRYLYSPSALMLEPGELHFAQKELMFSTFTLGLTDNISIMAGSALPLFLTGNNGIHAILGLKFGGEVAPDVHLAAGVQTLLINTNLAPTPVVPFASLTLGDAGTNLTLNVGGATGLTPTGFAGGFPIASVGGVHKFHGGFAVLTEHIFVNITNGNGNNIHAFAARFITDTFHTDVGFFMMGSGNTPIPIPIPWVDFSWSFKLF